MVLSGNPRPNSLSEAPTLLGGFRPERDPSRLIAQTTGCGGRAINEVGTDETNVATITIPICFDDITRL